MPGKFFCNDHNDILTDMLKGMKVVHPGLFISIDKRIVLLNRDRGDRVAILSGSGSGHEPFPVGFVGENMLTGCVTGPVFTTPSVPQIINALFNLNKWNKGGILIIGLNYVGTSLNFWIAARRAIEAGIKVKVVIMNDDVALEQNSMEERHINMTMKRGICGAVICAKILGGMSTLGYGLEQIYHHGTMIQLRTATISACYGSCQLPNHFQPLVKLNKDEILIGNGIHGEEGLKRVKMAPLKNIVKLMIEQIFEVFLIAEGDKVLLLLNDSGVCTEMELFILAREVELQLAPKVLVMKTFVGRFFTSLDMKGFQISITNITTNEYWISYMDLTTEAFAWPCNKLSEIQADRPERDISAIHLDRLLKPDRWKLNYGEAHIFGECIQATCNNIKKKEKDLNYMDALFRTGDVGTKMRFFADRILKDIKGASLLMDLSKTFMTMAQIAEEEVDSIIGEVLAVLFTGAAKGNYTWESVWQEALDTISMYTTARIGHRTLLDALIPAFRAYKAVLNENGPRFWKKALRHALISAENGCAETIRMRPKTWVEVQGTPALNTPDSVPDPGAYMVIIWLKSVSAETSKKRRFVRGTSKSKKNVTIVPKKR